MNGNAIGALLVIVPLVVGLAGLTCYGGFLLVRAIRAPRQQRRQRSDEGKDMNLKDALGAVKGAYSSLTNTYTELWDWEEQEREREAQVVPQPGATLIAAAQRYQNSRAGSLPVPAARPVAQPQPDEAEQLPTFDPERLSLSKGLERLLDEKALIVLGPKGSGKTTLGLALLHAVIYLGHEFCVIDPHAELNDWPEDLVVAGAGRNYAEANAFLRAVYAEMDIRYKKEHKARRTPLYVFVDEVPGISAKCKNWALVEDIIREARKVDIHFIILSQSELVKDIGLNTATKTNFTVLALGKARQAHMSEMTQLDKPEKRALILAYRPHQRAAVLDGEGMPALMDLTGADKVRTDRAQRIWQPDNLVLEQLDRAERDAMPVAQATQDDGLLAGLLSSVSGRNPAGTSGGTSFGKEEFKNHDVSSSNAGSGGLQEPRSAARHLLAGASIEEKRNLGRVVKLLTVEGREQATMHGFGLSNKGRGYSRGKALLDAYLLLNEAGLVER